MFIPDLSPLESTSEREAGLAVGWLDSEHPYPMGHVQPDAISRLADLCLVPVHQTRGFHACHFCNASREGGWLHGVRFEHRGTTRMLGSAEIRVQAADGTVFLAPDLIVHYVAEHDYLPPPSFLKALERIP
jgi:hypothetical protein